MRFCAYLLAALLCLGAGGTVGHAADPFTLDSVREQVRRNYSTVEQLPTGTFAQTLAQRPDILLLDVREELEYAVSHIPGAVRVDPGTWRWEFLRRYGDKARGKTVIFYCSVGVRSSRLAASVQAALKEEGAIRVFNLDGGIFAWHNEERALVNRKGATSHVHPFDKYWGKLVKRSDLLRTRPER